ncbi:VanW family protein, partial [Tyzzerella sp. OttesenSCG-928-J15]|nr:VanW family protein [Tyzzerella sp. OttesenSCG-928-J15]
VEIVERQNHSQKVGYADYGFDATLAGDYIDLKFRNDTGYPLTIESYIEGNKVYVNLYGYELHSPSRRLEFYNVFTGSVGAPAEKIVEDPSLPLGERYVKTSARNGANYDLYKIVYDGNTEISREQVNTSKYRARAAVVHVGTGEAVEGETPAEVEPTETTGEGASPEEVTPPAVSEQPQVEQPVTEPPVSETPAVPSETPSGQQEVYTPVVPQQTPQPMVTPNPSGSGEKPVEPAPVIVDPVIEVPSVDTPPIVD